MKRYSFFAVAMILIASLFAGCSTGSSVSQPAETAPADAEKTYVVHAYVPEIWGTPKIWAWSEYAGAVFEEKPGDSMMAEGDGWYSCRIPKWADKFVITGFFDLLNSVETEVQPRDVWVNVFKNGAVKFEYQSFEPMDAAYFSAVSGHGEEVPVTDDVSVLCLVLDRTVSDCIQMTVTMRVYLEEGASSREWQVFGYNNGSFQEIGTIDFAASAGYSHTTHTLTFSEPVTFDGILITPTDLVGDGNLSYDVYDFYTE